MQKKTAGLRIGLRTGRLAMPRRGIMEPLRSPSDSRTASTPFFSRFKLGTEAGRVFLSIPVYPIRLSYENIHRIGSNTLDRLRLSKAEPCCPSITYVAFFIRDQKGAGLAGFGGSPPAREGRSRTLLFPAFFPSSLR